jgi:hypothetical protein
VATGSERCRGLFHGKGMDAPAGQRRPAGLRSNPAARRPMKSTEPLATTPGQACSLTGGFSFALAPCADLWLRGQLRDLPGIARSRPRFPAYAALAGHVVQLDTERMEGIVGVGSQPEKLVVRGESALLHACLEPVQEPQGRTQGNVQGFRLPGRQVGAVHAGDAIRRGRGGGMSVAGRGGGGPWDPAPGELPTEDWSYQALTPDDQGVCPQQQPAVLQPRRVVRRQPPGRSFRPEDAREDQQSDFVGVPNRGAWVR